MAKVLKYENPKKVKAGIKAAKKNRKPEAIAARFHRRAGYPFMQVTSVLNKRFDKHIANPNQHTMQRFLHAQVVRHKMKKA